MRLVEFLTAARRTLWPQQYNKFCASWPRIADYWSLDRFRVPAGSGPVVLAK